MKVLHVIPSIGPARGGPSIVIRTMAESLAARGIQVDVVTTDDNGCGRIEAGKGPIEEMACPTGFFRGRRAAIRSHFR